MDATRLLIGWREWVSLPELGLPHIKAKVDTGAKTSALHAFDISTYHDSKGILKIRFKIHPLRQRRDIVVKCHARVVDHRFVSDSGGHREKRYVIETILRMGARSFPIELTLTNRETMAHRMLIGRSAMRSFMIDPSHVFLLGRPEKVVSSYKQTLKTLKQKKKKIRRTPKSEAGKLK